MKKPYKIQVFIHALALLLPFLWTVTSDTSAAAGGNAGAGSIIGHYTGLVLPYDTLPDGKQDTGSIYADAPQFAVPRNTSVSSHPRQHSTAKRTGHSGSPEATFKDGKVITRNSYTVYLTYIDLFPSGTRDFKTRLLSLKKLII